MREVISSGPSLTCKAAVGAQGHGGNPAPGLGSAPWSAASPRGLPAPPEGAPAPQALLQAEQRRRRLARCPGRDEGAAHSAERFCRRRGKRGRRGACGITWALRCGHGRARERSGSWASLLPTVTPSRAAVASFSVSPGNQHRLGAKPPPSPLGSRVEVGEPRAVSGHLHISDQTRFQTKRPHAPPSFFPPALAGLLWGFPGGRGSTSSPPRQAAGPRAGRHKSFPGGFVLQSCQEELCPPPCPSAGTCGRCGAGGTCPSLGSARRVGTPGAVLGPPLTPQAQKRAESAVLLHDSPPPERAEETNPAEPHKLLDSVLQHRAN
ncbi:uncharacterized protein LOC141971197 [Athene noctua]|uniref:uncharacterized protein LOC141971197 n=1 Tax=Athene noctua TaxID=126797 RepID=UPI003EB861AF